MTNAPATHVLQLFRLSLLVAGAALAVLAGAGSRIQAQGGCPGGNPIVCENQLQGDSDWDIGGVGDDTIQGFATDISVNVGATVQFKVDVSPAASFHLDIYRLGYYGGAGARRVDSVQNRPGVAQPGCLTDNDTGLVDCGNWSVSATWAVPATAVSGVYVAKAVRAGTHGVNESAGASHIVFVVRDDTRQADVLFQTSDTTWQAYNNYGGSNLYCGGPQSNAGSAYNCTGRATKVSYNRPFWTRVSSNPSWLLSAEYPMLRWLEANGFNVKYWSGVDTDRFGANAAVGLTSAIKPRVFLSVGHDEYWSGTQRTNVENARDVGVNLAFLSGNELLWKTRWESAIDGSGTTHRTLVSYKDTLAGTKIDPLPNVTTGTWRDTRFGPPNDGGRPENALIGSLWTVNSGTSSISVPASMAALRLWRHTRVAELTSGEATLGSSTLGYEWGEAVENGFQPAGLVHLSSSTRTGVEKIIDFGATVGLGTATHNLTLYRHNSGALVFGASTVQWSWGLASEHDGGSELPDQAMQQATVNLLADMGVQPSSLQVGADPSRPLRTTAASSDVLAPTSTITFPAPGGTVVSGTRTTITGTAIDNGGGVVGGVEVSVDGGNSWRRATGTSLWSLDWTPVAAGTAALRSRAIDDSGNIELATTESVVTVVNPQCPCSIWTPGVDQPAVADAGDPSAVELGMKFRAAMPGFITGLRFYKSAGNTGTHQGSLWTQGGTLLGTATFTAESPTGWQQVNFPTPIAVSANTTYVASYHTNTGHYSASAAYFAAAGVDTPPLHAMSNVTSPNSVYRYGTTGFPTLSYNATNYWVDVVFNATIGGNDTTPPTVLAITPAQGATGIGTATPVVVTFNEPLDPASVNTSTIELLQGASLVPSSVTYDAPTRTATLTPTDALAYGTTYTARVRGGGADPRVKDFAGNALAADRTTSFTTVALTACPCNLWPAGSGVPAIVDAGDANAVELGVKFSADTNGFITGLRFYKSSANTGPHIGNLWTGAGALLATATFSAESASGWQEVSFSTPVAVMANTIYVASYHTSVGHYSVTAGYFATAVDAPPLQAPANAANANGVYRYGASGFPSNSYNAGNYWVDVVFNTATGGTDTTPPTVSAINPASGATGVGTSASVSVSFSEPVNPATVTTATVELREGAILVPAGVTYDSSTRTAILTPATALTPGATYTTRVRGGGADPRVKDLAGNALAADFTSSFTATSPAVCPCSLWPSGTGVPATIDVADSNALELGVKFRPDTDGFITAVRFYKSAANTGTHVGNLWTSGGTLLATAVFTAESFSGWQEVSFPTPVAVTANTTYVASYHTNTGHYSYTGGYFAAAGVDVPPLHALANSTSDNGVYRYGASGFPSSSYNAANYWVDVVFNTASAPEPPTGFVDTTALNFGAGQLDIGAYVSATGDGEVMLAPVLGDEYSGSALSAGWSAAPWGGSSSTVVGNGLLTVDGARVSALPLYSAGRSLEFAATFSGAPYQHAGYGVTFSEGLWAIFSSGPGDALYARTNDGVVATNTPIAGSWFGGRHQFRIDWTPAGLTYWIDGTIVAVHAQAISASLRPILSDYGHDGNALAVAWVRLSPYATLAEAPGQSTFTSRVFDAASPVTWTTAAWTGTTPPGTSVALLVRYGNTPTPDGSWTLFTTVSGPLNGVSRYVQYRLALTTTDPNQSPTVSGVSLNFNP